jgi:F-type H+-transporting ATPase subunit b
MLSMLRAWNPSRLLVFSLALLVGSGTAPRAAGQEAHPEAKGHTAAVKYEAEVHDPATGKTTTKTFDLSKPEDKAALEEAISGGHAHEVRLQKTPSLVELFSLLNDLGFWTLVVFLLLLFVLSRLAWPKMIEGLQKREERIRGALDEAQKAKEEASTIRISLQKQLDEAHDVARQIMDEARRAAQVLRDEEMGKTRAEIQTERERLHREIETETDQALQRIWTQAAELATQVSAKALRRGLTEDGHRQLIDEAVAELRQAATRGSNGHAYGRRV